MCVIRDSERVGLFFSLSLLEQADLVSRASSLVPLLSLSKAHARIVCE